MAVLTKIGIHFSPGFDPSKLFSQRLSPHVIKLTTYLCTEAKSITSAAIRAISLALDLAVRNLPVYGHVDARTWPSGRMRTRLSLAASDLEYQRSGGAADLAAGVIPDRVENSDVAEPVFAEELAITRAASVDHAVRHQDHAVARAQQRSVLAQLGGRALCQQRGASRIIAAMRVTTWSGCDDRARSAGAISGSPVSAAFAMAITRTRTI
jgi:hypothetical protein